MRGNFIYKRLGDNIAKIRRSNSFSQEEVSLTCNIDRTYLGKVEQGKANPSLRVMVKLSRFFKIKLSDLVKGV